MSQARLPITGSDANTWSDILNRNITQTNSELNGAFNSFDQFSQRPNNLTVDDSGKTYLYTQTGNWHEWNGNEWKIQNKSEINVKDYGAIGDGVADDTMSLQSVLNSLTNGGKVYVPKGRYKFTSPLSLLSNTTLFGDGQNNTDQNGTVFLFAGSGLLLETNFVHNINLLDFAIIGSGVGDGLRIIKNAFCKFDNIFITNFEIAIFCGGQVNNYFSNLVLTQCKYGIFNVTGVVDVSQNNTMCTLQNIYINGCSEVGVLARHFFTSSFKEIACDGCKTGFILTKNSLCTFENIYTELDSLSGIIINENNKISVKNIYVGVSNTLTNYTGAHIFSNTSTEIVNLDVDGQYFNNANPVEGQFTHILCDNNSSSTTLVNYKISNTNNPQFVSNTNFDIIKEEGKKMNLMSGLYTSNSNFDTGHLQIGNHHLWIDADGKLRIKNGQPTGDSDGTTVGSQV